MATRSLVHRSFCTSSTPRRVLVLTKITRYEFEKSRLGSFSCESDFRFALQASGSRAYESLRRHHELHVNYVQSLLGALRTLRVPEVRTASRLNLSSELVDWADLILTAGGDGTFLMGASKVRDASKPVIGFNTDPSKSEGYLLLPKGLEPLEALQRIWKSPDWYYRSRLRITLFGPRDKISGPPLEIHQQKVTYPEYRFIEESKEGPDGGSPSNQDPTELVLPVLALNEVFVGESLSSRVSSLQISIDDSPPLPSKNSGFCIATGSGSTSWTFNINKLTHASVRRILELAAGQVSSSSPQKSIPLHEDPQLISKVTSSFNNELLFDPRDSRMSYTTRDAIYPGTFPVETGGGIPPPRGFANKSIRLTSLCFDACLVIDGSLSFRFNDGISALIENRPQDALKTVVMD